MYRIFFLCLCISAGIAQAEMPEEVKKSIDENLIGRWSVELIYDGQVMTGTITEQWSADESAVSIQQHINTDDGPVSVQGLLGWDSTTKSLVEHSFSSTGDHWTIRWKLSDKDLWKGEGKGTYEGEPWNSETEIKFDGKTFRYQDETAGKTFVMEGTREAANGEDLFAKHAGYLSGGTWHSDQKKIDTHILSKQKKWVRIESKESDEQFSAVYGVDPRTGELTLWGFDEDGKFGKWVCTSYTDGKWTWKGTTFSDDGQSTGVAQLSKQDDDNFVFEITVDDEAAEPATWTRKDSPATAGVAPEEPVK